MKSKKMKWFAAMGAAFALSAPSVASAQLFEVTPEDAIYGGLLTSSSSTVISMIPLAFTVYGGGNTEWEWLLTSSSSSLQITSEIDAPSKQRRRRTTRRRVLSYIQRNKAAVGQDVMLGGGEALTDVASMLGVPEDDRADFAAAARDARAEIRPLLMDASAGLPELDAALTATVAAFVARRSDG